MNWDQVSLGKAEREWSRPWAAPTGQPVTMPNHPVGAVHDRDQRPQNEGIRCPLLVHRITTNSCAWWLTTRSFPDRLMDLSNFFCLATSPIMMHASPAPFASGRVKPVALVRQFEIAISVVIIADHWLTTGIQLQGGIVANSVHTIHSTERGVTTVGIITMRQL